MTIYLDIVFVENIIMNYIILFATGIICKEKIRQIRIIISSIIGSIYSVAYYITEITLYETIIAKILLSILMPVSPSGTGKTFKLLIIFYLTSFAFGGCAFAILYYIKPQNILYQNGKFIGLYPVKIAILGRTTRIFNN